MMKRFFCLCALVSVVIGAILLSSCGPIYNTQYSYTPPKSYRGRLCVNQCASQKSTCQNNCRVLNQACRMQANAVAEPEYRAYLHSMRKQGKTPWQSISNFADYSGCNSNCGCEANYRQCYTTCGGIVSSRTVCTAFCHTANSK